MLVVLFACSDLLDVDSSLATKNIRRNWEDQFVTKAFTPLLVSLMYIIISQNVYLCIFMNHFVRKYYLYILK